MSSGKSLASKMEEALALSFSICYSELLPDGTLFTAREIDNDMVWAWADGLTHKYYYKHLSGRCSVQAGIDFDVGEFEASVDRDIAEMRRLLRTLRPPVRLTDAELRRRGYVVAHTERKSGVQLTGN